MDQMYKLAYEYRKTKLWKKMSDDKFFAIKLDDGKIGFINIMGQGNGYNAINLTVGEDNLINLKNFIESDFDLSKYEYFESTLFIESYQLILGNKDDLETFEVEEVRKYKKENNIKLSGSFTFPYFRKSLVFSPFIQFDSENDYDYIKQAINACIDLAYMLKNSSVDDLGIYSIYDDPSILVLEKEKTSYKIKDSLDIDWNKESTYPSATIIDIDTIRKIKKSKKLGVIECRLLVLPSPVDDNEHQVFYPQIIIGVDKRNGELISTEPVKNYTEDPNELVKSFFEKLSKRDYVPKKMSVSDNRTYELLKEICSSCKIKLSLKNKLEDLDILISELFSKLDESFVDDFDDLSDQLDNEEILEILYMMEHMANKGENPPKELLDLLMYGVQDGIFSDEISEEIMRVLNKFS